MMDFLIWVLIWAGALVTTLVFMLALIRGGRD